MNFKINAMGLPPDYLQKIKDFDQAHQTHLNTSGTIFSTCKLPSKNLNPPKTPHETNKSSILSIIREKDRFFLETFNVFLSNFSLIDTQYLKIYHKFLSSIFRNGAYQNCIKELIHMYNDLVSEHNRFLHEYEPLIRIKTYQDLESLPNDSLSHFELKLEAYLKTLREVKLQRTSKYLKLVKKRELNQKPFIFDSPSLEENLLYKIPISLEQVLEQFEKVYNGEDEVEEGVVQGIISEKLTNESRELKKLFYQDINMNYEKELDRQFIALQRLLQENNKENQGDDNEKQKTFAKEEEKNWGFPLQMKEKAYYNEKSDDLVYSKSFKNKDFIEKMQENEISFRNSLNNESSQDYKENNNDFPRIKDNKKRRKRQERIKIKEIY